MLSLALDVSLPPLLVAGASLAQRRWGQTIGGRIVGLPLTSVPLLLLLALSKGTTFAAAAAAATVAGTMGQAVLTWVFARVAVHRGPAVSLAASVAAFAGVAVLLDHLTMGPVVGAALATVVLGALLARWPVAPRHEQSGDDVRAPGRQGATLLARMAVAGAFALIVNEAAAPLGAHLAGLVTSLPALSIVMFTVTYRQGGRSEVITFTRGVAAGTFSVITALLVLALLLPTGHLWLAFAAAVAASLLTQVTGQAGKVATALLRAGAAATAG